MTPQTFPHEKPATIHPRSNCRGAKERAPYVRARIARSSPKPVRVLLLRIGPEIQILLPENSKTMKTRKRIKKAQRRFVKRIGKEFCLRIGGIMFGWTSSQTPCDLKP
jgi:hypothetical protein